MDRPVIFDFKDPIAFIERMLRYRKLTEPTFSIHAATKSMRRCSPTLVSLVLKKKRNLSLDRLADFAKLAGLNAQEQSYIRDWLCRDESKEIHHPKRQHVKPDNHVLKDWLNVYVKDAFGLLAIQHDPRKIYHYLGNVATERRIDQALEFLLKEGYLIKDKSGQIKENQTLSMSTDGVSSKKIRDFHKNALKIAQRSLEIFPTNERLINTLVTTLTYKDYKEALELIAEFSQRMISFTTERKHNGDRLYQIIFNINPIGGGPLDK